ncbi:hypothetical protein C4K68_20345 [Pokkaliibacter plantistimulans]|uniref:Uncharacterized protein n=1 Tax=Proteobacteria bacterium 228 TaxID=2083153 RepID=A0A2S5KKU9_9PROT|nr:type 4b pilus protein PilO2 [Pokkaliibacter plantistimulans]PPC75467.1 hypothetical protein C4K68_20345 [Pokkaliibacter plantistimulans]
MESQALFYTTESGRRYAVGLYWISVKDKKTLARARAVRSRALAVTPEVKVEESKEKHRGALMVGRPQLDDLKRKPPIALLLLLAKLKPNCVVLVEHSGADRKLMDFQGQASPAYAYIAGSYHGKPISTSDVVVRAGDSVTAQQNLQQKHSSYLEEKLGDDGNGKVEAEIYKFKCWSELFETVDGWVSESKRPKALVAPYILKPEPSNALIMSAFLLLIVGGIGAYQYYVSGVEEQRRQAQIEQANYLSSMDALNTVLGVLAISQASTVDVLNAFLGVMQHIPITLSGYGISELSCRVDSATCSVSFQNMYSQDSQPLVDFMSTQSWSLTQSDNPALQSSDVITFSGPFEVITNTPREPVDPMSAPQVIANLMTRIHNITTGTAQATPVEMINVDRQLLAKKGVAVPSVQAFSVSSPIGFTHMVDKMLRSLPSSIVSTISMKWSSDTQGSIEVSGLYEYGN